MFLRRCIVSNTYCAVFSVSIDSSRRRRKVGVGGGGGGLASEKPVSAPVTGSAGGNPGGAGDGDGDGGGGDGLGTIGGSGGDGGGDVSSKRLNPSTHNPLIDAVMALNPGAISTQDGW